MNNFRSEPSHPRVRTNIVDLIERDSRLATQSGPFEWWYHLTAPAKQPLSAPLEQREIARQGRLTSTVLAMVAGSLIILALPTSFALHSPTLLIVLCVLLTVVTLSLILNRIGKGFLGGLLVVIAMNLSLAISIITWPGGLTTNTLPILDIIVVEPTLVALALLPPRSVFVVALFNSIFIIADFALQSRSPDLIHVMSFDGYEVITRPLYLLVFVVGIVYPVMRSTLRTIVLGDRATEIAKVQQDLTEQEHIVAQEKHNLDADIVEIVHTHVRASKDPGARVAMERIHILSQVAGSLNNLLARLQSYRQATVELARTQAEIVRLVQDLHQAKKGIRVPRRMLTGTAVDELILEISAEYNVYEQTSLRNTEQPWNNTSRTSNKQK